MPERDHLTILHLSDMQFGKNHLFQDKVPYPDGRFESLWERLRDDLDERRTQEGLVPDLVVVSGDLAEWGLPSEFKQAGTFLEQLTGNLSDAPKVPRYVVP